ncbi:LysR family transcriptional regulator [Spongiactinospora rosea]|uniref:LysR family transcriptional regulator n=1 Tax=Spongiactinospora rosea TaxID=2248750 RepID=A0A366LY95_9ACTN|nr:LysR family transcriptional regulator [Spongiactinospora rosea]
MTRLRGVDLNLFVVFATVLREGNVTRAAEHLRMSQAAVSASLTRLRRLFHDPLFVRVPGGVAPTVLARQLSGRIEAALTTLHVAVAGEPAFDPAADHAVFRLGMSDDLEALLMPRLIARVAETSPASSLRCLLANRMTITGLLDEGSADVGVVASDRWGPDYRSRVLFESGYATVYDRTAFGRTGALTREEYVAAPHVMISANGARGIVDDVLEAEGLRRHKLASTAHFAMVPLLLARSTAVATMPRHVAEVLAADFGLEVCEPPFRLPRFTVSVLWHHMSGKNPAVMWLVRTIAEVSAQVSGVRHVLD